MTAAPATTHRGRPRSAEADQAILRAALEMVSEDGYAGLTMAGVAHRAGVSTATLYRRFHDKDDLIIDAIAHMNEDKALPDTGSLAGDLRAMVSTHVDYMKGEGGGMMKGLISEVSRNPELHSRLRERLIDPRRQELREVFERAVARGEIDEVGDIAIVQALIGGPVMWRFLVSGEPLTPRVVDGLVAMLLRALGHRS